MQISPDEVLVRLLRVNQQRPAAVGGLGPGFFPDVLGLCRPPWLGVLDVRGLDDRVALEPQFDSCSDMNRGSGGPGPRDFT